MKCRNARRLFGRYWDDETTQAEREWLESHFATCVQCRREYEELARVIETVGGLPRHEPAPELLERTLAQSRRVSPARDLLPERRAAFAPAAAIAAALVIAAVITQWAGYHPRASGPGGVVLVRPVMTGTSPHIPGARLPAAKPPAAPSSGAAIAAAPDSLFDHSDDIEFVLDPVTLRRGRATVTRSERAGITTQQAVVSF